MLIYIRNGRLFSFFKKDKTTVIPYGITVNPLNRIFFKLKVPMKKYQNVFYFLLCFAFLLPFPTFTPSLLVPPLLFCLRKRGNTEEQIRRTNKDEYGNSFSFFSFTEDK